MYKEIFTMKLKEARKINKMTTEEVAKALNISRPTYTNYETGRREPNIETLGKMADLFCVSLDWLVGTGISEKGNP